VRLFHYVANHVERHVQLDLSAYGFRVSDEIGVRVGASEEPSTAKAAYRGTLGRFGVKLLPDGAQALLTFRLLLGPFALRLLLS
jgi:hypothetical protein